MSEIKMIRLDTDEEFNLNEVNVSEKRVSKKKLHTLSIIYMKPSICMTIFEPVKLRFKIFKAAKTLNVLINVYDANIEKRIERLSSLVEEKLESVATTASYNPFIKTNTFDDKQQVQAMIWLDEKMAMVRIKEGGVSVSESIRPDALLKKLDGKTWMGMLTLVVKSGYQNKMGSKTIKPTITEIVLREELHEQVTKVNMKEYNQNIALEVFNYKLKKKAATDTIPSTSTQVENGSLFQTGPTTQTARKTTCNVVPMSRDSSSRIINKEQLEENDSSSGSSSESD